MEGVADLGVPPLHHTSPHLTCLALASCLRRGRSAAQPAPCQPSANCVSGGCQRPVPLRSSRRKTSPKRRSDHAPKRRARSASSSRGRRGRLPTASAGLVLADLASVPAAQRRRRRQEPAAPYIPAPGHGSQLQTPADQSAPSSRRPRPTPPPPWRCEKRAQNPQR